MAEYIEREAALQVVADIMGDCKVDHKHRAINRNTKQIPAADVVEVRRGEWLPYPSDAYMKCSICGMEYHKSRMPDVVGYCPNPSCGAKMDGKGDNNG